MRRISVTLWLFALLWEVHVSGVDLQTIDRTIRKEPVYQSKPTYCLLVFGPDASTRVWLVQDGERIYVDANANGDLTEPSESFAPSKREEFTTQVDNKPAPYRTLIYSLGRIVPADKSGPHTEFKLTRYQIGNPPANYVLSLKVNGEMPQFAGWAPIFTRKKEEATVIHFGGPVIVQPLRHKELSLSTNNLELHLRFATPGLGKQSFASLGYEAVPAKIHPVAEIQWPARPGSAPAEKTTVTLLSRC
jgi:hypothetical protein